MYVCITHKFEQSLTMEGCSTSPLVRKRPFNKKEDSPFAGPSTSNKQMKPILTTFPVTLEKYYVLKYHGTDATILSSNQPSVRCQNNKMSDVLIHINKNV
jgi:hypothetical protein